MNNEVIELLYEYRYMLRRQLLSMEGQIKHGTANEKVKYKHGLLTQKLERLERALNEMV